MYQYMWGVRIARPHDDSNEQGGAHRPAGRSKDQNKRARDALRLDALPDVLTVVEFARLMRIGRNSAYEAIRRGDVGSVRIGRRVVIPRAAVLALLRSEKPR